jgi:nucleoside-diphosphate-sugar epimerase
MNRQTEQHVIFGVGPLGRAVMRALRAEGKPVRMVNRSGKAEGLPAEVPLAACDANQPRQVQAVTAGASHVYQCAQPAYTKWPTEFIPLQNSIIEGVAANGAKLIIGDNLYMYGFVQGPIHEGLPNAATTIKGRVRAQAAEQALAAHKAGKLQVLLVRASDFYGPHVLDSALGDRVFKPLLAGKAAGAIGDINAPHTYTHINDFGAAMAMLGGQEDTFGQIWHAPNAPTLSTQAVLKQAFAVAEMPVKISVMGKMMLRIGGLFIPEAREMIEMTYQFEHPFVVESSKFSQRFPNYTPTSYAQGLKDTLDWYRTHHA